MRLPAVRKGDDAPVKLLRPNDRRRTSVEVIVQRPSKTAPWFFVALVTLVLAGCAPPASSFAFDVKDAANDASSASPEVTRMFGFVDGDAFVLAVTFTASVVEDDVIGYVAFDADGDPSTFAFEEGGTETSYFCGAGTADYELFLNTKAEVAFLTGAFEPSSVAQVLELDLDPPVWENLLGARRLVVRIPGTVGLSDATDAAALFGNDDVPTDCVPGGGASL